MDGPPETTLNCDALILKAKATEGEPIRTSRIYAGESQPYYLDVIAFIGQTRLAHIGLTARLLRELWARGLAAVASCEYEQALPHDGRGGGGAL
ncbi:MAG TPA: hypothetical protein VF818_12165 [Ktedonobacterales bacterium]